MSDKYSSSPSDLLQFDWVSKYPRLFGKPPFEGFEPNSTFVEVGKGWYPMLDAMFEEIEREIEAEPDSWVAIDQIKEKWGTLSFYYTGGNDRIDKIVEKYEDRSEVTCERCGGEDATRRSRGWIKTLCGPCHAQMQARQDKHSRKPR